MDNCNHCTTNFVQHYPNWQRGRCPNCGYCPCCGRSNVNTWPITPYPTFTFTHTNEPFPQGQDYLGDDNMTNKAD